MHYHYFTLEQRANLESLIRAQMSEQSLAKALARLRAPDYGVCARCGADIPYVSLMRSPASELCPACVRSGQMR